MLNLTPKQECIEQLRAKLVAFNMESAWLLLYGTD